MTLTLDIVWSIDIYFIADDNRSFTHTQRHPAYLPLRLSLKVRRHVSYLLQIGLVSTSFDWQMLDCLKVWNRFLFPKDNQHSTILWIHPTTGLCISEILLLFHFSIVIVVEVVVVFLWNVIKLLCFLVLFIFLFLKLFSYIYFGFVFIFAF